MKKNSIPEESVAVENEKTEDIGWEMRPSGMLVQKRDDDAEAGASSTGPMITINVSRGSAKHQLYLPAQSTFGDMKKHLAQRTGLKPEEQRLLFRGKEKDDEEHLHMVGVKDMSKILLLEDPASKDMKLDEILEDPASKETKLNEILEDPACKETKLEEVKISNEMTQALEAVASVKAEVDKLSERVAALEVAVDSGTKVDEKEFVVSTELLMRQLLKLDGIKAEGEAKLQRKAEVRRVQNLVETLDVLKERNSKPSSNDPNTVSVTTEWKTFESGVGSLKAPPPVSSSTRVTQDWEQFD